VLNAFQQQPGVLLLADRGRRRRSAGGPRLPHRRPGRGRQHPARGRRPDHPLRRHRHRQDIPVTYTGILPDLFKEGKGVVAEGKLGADGLFAATQVLAKHDENYMPPEAASALEQASRRRRRNRPSRLNETESPALPRAVRPGVL
jgi:hypothetical protein